MDDTILLVDDEPNVPAGIIRNLRGEPYRLLSAFSAQQALEIMNNEDIDILITDEKMPEMLGSELVARVRIAYPSVICMILSGCTDFHSAIKSINEGEIYRFLTKPCEPLEIATAIRHALKQKSLLVESRLLLEQNRLQQLCINKLEKEFPGIASVERDENGYIVLDDTNTD